VDTLRPSSDKELVQPRRFGADRRPRIEEQATDIAVERPFGGAGRGLRERQELRACQRHEAVAHREQGKRSLHRGDKRGMSRIDRFEAQRPIDRQRDAVAVMPFADDHRELPRRDACHRAAVDQQLRLGSPQAEMRRRSAIRVGRGALMAMAMSEPSG
jgi:hypothetical protein